MNKLDALLINPVSARTLPAFVPHGLLYIASQAIRSGYKVAVYDRNTDDLDIEKILIKNKPAVVGLGCLTGSAINDAIYISRTIRKFDSGIKIVWGGIHTTLYPDSVLKENFVDFVIVGDGEYPFTGILDNLIAGKNSLEAIGNLGYKSNGQIKYTNRVFVDMDALPQPAWHLISVEKYIRRKFYAKRVLTINTSRGCPYRCSFCCVPTVHLGKWRAQGAEKIIAGLQYLKSNYHIDGFQVDDDEFDINTARVLKFCDLLESNNMNLKWLHFSRINIVKEEVLRREIKCGLQLIAFGVESGSERMLKFLNKGQTKKMIVEAYEVCRKLRLKTCAMFMIGLPTEGPEELRETVGLIKRINPYITMCTVYRPYPGSELFNYCIERGLFSYPDKLENVAKVYEQFVNMSTVPGKIINWNKSYFDRNNIYQEIKCIITRFKLGLLIYYFFYYIIKPKWGFLNRTVKG